MEEALPLLSILRFLPLELGGGKNGTGVCINDLLPFVISLVWFWLKMRTCVDSGASISATNDCLASHVFVM